jgi:guanidinoacetate N-methyltransferase
MCESNLLTSHKLTMFIQSSDGTINSYPVMEKWEEPYMNKLAQIVCTHSLNGKILEIGYGMGISARYIDQYDLKEHVIIESNKELYENCLLYAKTGKKMNITPIYGCYEDVVKNLEKESFDGILFDAYSTKELMPHHNFFPLAFELLKNNGIFTYFCPYPIHISTYEENLLKKTGFSKIEYEVVKVEPPPLCSYWKYKSIVAPIIIK